MLWCLVELRQIDIITKVLLSSSHLALTREGNLEAIFCTFSYLNIRHNSKLVLGPSYATINMDTFEYNDWRQLYGDFKEAIRPEATTS